MSASTIRQSIISEMGNRGFTAAIRSDAEDSETIEFHGMGNGKTVSLKVSGETFNRTDVAEADLVRETVAALLAEAESTELGKSDDPVEGEAD